LLRLCRRSEHRHLESAELRVTSADALQERIGVAGY
jgi:hypothetical protein